MCELLRGNRLLMTKTFICFLVLLVVASAKTSSADAKWPCPMDSPCDVAQQINWAAKNYHLTLRQPVTEDLIKRANSYFESSLVPSLGIEAHRLHGHTLIYFVQYWLSNLPSYLNPLLQVHCCSAAIGVDATTHGSHSLCIGSKACQDVEDQNGIVDI